MLLVEMAQMHGHDAMAVPRLGLGWKDLSVENMWSKMSLEYSDTC